ncbi:MAG: response regulator transcription factor, partial [Desulfobacteraceae bacterium]
MTISVVLADDHAVVRDGLKTLLEIDQNINVVGMSSNGREAVRLITKLRPDVVVMDISMPELNGIEATRQILEQCPDTRVIILSMHATKEHIHRALQAGAKGYLLKESAGAEVVKAVRSVYLGNRYLVQPVAELLIDDYLNGGRAEKFPDPLDQLSAREREVLQLVVEGNASAKIADTLCLSPKTVETYRSRIMAKLNIKDIPGLVKFAIQNGLISLD